MVEIERSLKQLGKRNVVSSLFHSRDDKERIAAWRVDLNRILLVFNVRSMASPPASPDHCSQGKLILDTNIVATDTNNMVLDLHRVIMAHQDGGKVPVGDSCTLFIN